MDYNFTISEEINGPVLAAVLAIEMVVALIANTAVLVITVTQKKSWKVPSTIFFTSLIVAHFFMNVFYTPFFVISAATGEWIFGSTLQQKNGTCAFAAFMLWYCALVISTMLAVISFDRFLFIVKPHVYKRYMKAWVALTVVIALWLLIAILNSTPLFGLGRFGYTRLYGCCVPILEGYPGYLAYMLLLFALIVGVIAVTSIWTFCFTHKFLRNHSEMAQTGVYMSKKQRLFGIFGAMLLVYGLCFSPGFIVGVLSQLTSPPAAVYVTVLVCFIFITVANPLVQSYFRLDVKRSLACFYRKIVSMATVTTTTNDQDTELSKNTSIHL